MILSNKSTIPKLNSKDLEVIRNLLMILKCKNTKTPIFSSIKDKILMIMILPILITILLMIMIMKIIIVLSIIMILLMIKIMTMIMIIKLIQNLLLHN